jgi:hypothetical protein
MSTCASSGMDLQVRVGVREGESPIGTASTLSVTCDGNRTFIRDFIETPAAMRRDVPELNNGDIRA